MRLPWRRRPPLRAPEGVRIILRDGSVIPAEMVYSGWDGDFHVWTVASATLSISEPMWIQCDVLPGRTSIQFDARP